MNDFVKYHLPLLLWMLIIFVSSAIPSFDFPEVPWWGWAKIVHLIYYGFLCFLAWRAAPHQTTIPSASSNPKLAAWILTLLYGASDEFHQLFTPGRHGRVTDVMIDGVGGLLFLAALYVYTRIQTAMTRSSSDSGV